MNYCPPQGAGYSTQALQIHDAVWKRLTTKLTGFVSFNTSPFYVVQPANLPRVGVDILRDNAQSIDDEVLTGEPKYTHYLTIGISVATLASDDMAQFKGIEQQVANIYNILLQDPTFVGGTDSPIEGITRIDRKTQFSSVGEMPLAEIQIEMTFRYWTTWPPIVPDDFLRMHLETRFEPIDDPDIRPEVIADWMILQNVVETESALTGAGSLTCDLVIGSS
jgi:hypothetical protein